MMVSFNIKSNLLQHKWERLCFISEYRILVHSNHFRVRLSFLIPLKIINHVWKIFLQSCIGLHKAHSVYYKFSCMPLASSLIKLSIQPLCTFYSNMFCILVRFIWLSRNDSSSSLEYCTEWVTFYIVVLAPTK